MDKIGLQALFDNESSIADIIIKIGGNPKSGGAYRTINKYVKLFDIDLTKFNITRKQRSNKHLTSLNKTKKIPLEEILIEHSTYGTSELKPRLFQSGLLTNLCVKCGNTGEHNGEPLTLQLDHINGNNRDNRIENLRILCPNCHSQTLTYGRKNRNIKPKTSLYQELQKQKHKPLIDKVLNSDIDFGKFGWTRQAAKLLDLKPWKICKWFKRYMPEFYEEKCYKKLERATRLGLA